MTLEPEPEPIPTAAAVPASAAPQAAAQPIDTDIADGIEHRLDPRSITLERLSNLVGNAAVAAVLGGAVFLAPRMTPLTSASRPLLGVLWLIAAAALAWHAWAWPRLHYRHAWYRVDHDEIEIRRGVLWRSVIDVPRSRVQHTDVSQGPWQRRFGLGTLTIYTAGTAHAKVSLPGLAHERALVIREHLLPRGEHDVI